MKTLCTTLITITLLSVISISSAMNLRNGKVAGDADNTIRAEEITLAAQFILSDDHIDRLHESAPQYVSALKRLPMATREQMFFFAVEYNLLSAIQMLLAADVDINVHNASGDAAIHIATSHDFRNIIGFLITHRARIDARDVNGSNVLMRAAAEGNINLVAWFLDPERGFYINDHDYNGNTAMHHAITNKEECLPIVMLLAAHGANVLTNNHQGVSPLMLAYAHHCQACQILRYMEERARIETRIKEEQRAQAFFFDHHGSGAL